MNRNQDTLGFPAGSTLWGADSHPPSTDPPTEPCALVHDLLSQQKETIDLATCLARELMCFVVYAEGSGDQLPTVRELLDDWEAHWKKLEGIKPCQNTHKDTPMAGNRDA